MNLNIGGLKMGWIIDKGLQIFDLKETERKPFKKIWLPIFVVFAVLPVVAGVTGLTGDRVFSPTIDKVILFASSLVICSNILVAYDTYGFWKISFDVLYLHDPNSRESINNYKKTKLNYALFTVFNFITIFISILILLAYIITFFYDYKIWYFLLFINEVCAIAIFLMFCIADYVMIKQLKDSTSITPDNRKLRAMQKFTQAAFPTIDLVGFFGVLSIFILVRIFNHSENHFFTQGFTTGALVFHILFTQFNYAYLKTIELKDSEEITGSAVPAIR